jgi:SpoVK/Ycf46/Vps4 family AAA+-type ATPase
MPIAAGTRPARLAWEDLAYLGYGPDLVSRVVAQATDCSLPGVNVLLHGPPGHGQHDFALLLADRCDSEILPVVAAGLEPDALREQLLVARRRTILLVDEAEKILGDGFRSLRSTMSREELVRLLRRVGAPALWIADDVRGTGRWQEGLEPFILQAMSAAIEFRAPPPHARRRLWDRCLGDAASLSEDERDALARRYEVTVEQIESSVRTAEVLGNGQVEAEVLNRILENSVTLVSGREPEAQPADDMPYRIEALTTSVDLVALTERLTRPGAHVPPVSLCLHGPSGTGKSEFVRRLARKMGRKLIEKRVSQIEDKWVGATEKNIAAAFAEAEREGAVLLFDEADSFLRARTEARYRWDVTLVNEFLQQLERFPGVVACTTNLFNELDPAVLRRFTFKVEFGYLGPEQAMTLFEALRAKVVGGEPMLEERRKVAKRLGALGRVTPGDFAVVARRAELMAKTWGHVEILRELEAEVMARAIHRTNDTTDGG